MGYREDMERCRAYIDAHLSEEIQLRTLADEFGYSFYHFCHVFRSVNGMAVGRYMRDKRLNRAAAELLDGRSVTDAAMDCGFDTPSGFTKAFTRHFGMSPSQYKMRKGGIKQMKAEFKRMEKIKAVGYVLKPEGDIKTLDNGAYWLGKDFSGVSKEDYAKLTSPGYAEIGAWIRPDEKTGELHYFLGPTVKEFDFVPGGMEALTIPAAEYAVFKVPDAKDPKELHDNVQKTWQYIFGEWFDSSGYSFDESKYDFEYYCADDTFIYVPVLKK